MNEQDLSIYKQKLESMLLEIGEYLSKTEESAAAVEPDKRSWAIVENGGNTGSTNGTGTSSSKKKDNFLKLKMQLVGLNRTFFWKMRFCGKKISSDRLDVFPEVQTCVNCA